MSDSQAPGKRREEVALTLIAAAFSGDIEAAIACCSTGLELRMEGIQTVHGHDGLRHVMEFNAEVSTDVRVTIHHVLSSDDTVAISRTTYLTINGQDVALDVGAFFEFEGDLVRRWVDYQDMRPVTNALGH